jgi:spore germination cell wall hydrolase CwlJ-like protein
LIRKLKALLVVAVILLLISIVAECASNKEAAYPCPTMTAHILYQPASVEASPTPIPTSTPTPTPTPAPLYEQCGLSEEEFEFFARVVQAEAGNHEEGQKWVAEVIWNRVNDYGGYGGSVTHVLTASGQFSTVKKGDCKTKATDGARIAIVAAYTEEIIPVNILYFRCGYAFKGHTFYDECGGNYFSYG